MYNRKCKDGAENAIILQKNPVENYNELQGCREQCTVADLCTEVLITLL